VQLTGVSKYIDRLRFAMANSIVGIWTLKAVEFRTDDGHVLRPFGLHPRGLMIISRDGYFALQVMDPRRAPFGSGDVFGATLEEKASAMQGFSAYSGTYVLHGNRITIRIGTSLFPNWVGHDEERSFEFKGDTLEMQTKSVLAGGRKVSADVIWTRAAEL
jgi:hypothetical protein